LFIEGTSMTKMFFPVSFSDLKSSKKLKYTFPSTSHADVTKSHVQLMFTSRRAVDLYWSLTPTQQRVRYWGKYTRRERPNTDEETTNIKFFESRGGMVKRGAISQGIHLAPLN